MFEILIYLIFFSWLYIAVCHGRIFFSRENFFWSNKIVFEKKFLYEIQKVMKKKERKKKVCVIIPARDEEKSLAKCIEGLMHQRNYILEIILVDDNSKDKTAKIAQQTFLEYNFVNFKIIQGKVLPEGWSGKTWALNQGKDLALKNKNAEYLLFIDADIFLEKEILQNVQKILEKKKLTMISLMAKLNCTSLWEKLLIPSFIFFFQKLYPFNQVNKKDTQIAAAAGGFVFCRKDIFEKENLFEKIKDKIIDDCNLAKMIKQKGHIWLGLTDQVKSIRVYKSLKDIWNMVSRTAYEQLKYSLFYLFFSVLGMIYLYQLVPWFIITESLTISQELSLLLFATYLLTTMIFLPTIKFYNLSFIYVFLLPISSFLYTLMTINSAYNFHFKKGNMWKNRTYK